MNTFASLLVGIVALGIIAFVPPSQASAAEVRSSTIWTTSGAGGVTVTPYVRSDRKALFIDFDHFTGTMDYVYYNLNYTNKESGQKGGVEGSFLANQVPFTGYYNGLGYVRREVLFGTCSQGICIIHKPKNVMLTVNTHYENSKIAQVTQVVSIPDSQF